MSHPDDPTDISSFPWWMRLIGPLVDVVENVLDPIADHVEPIIERRQAQTMHRRVSEARRVLEHRTVRCQPYEHAHRASLLRAWAELEAAAAQTRRTLHTHHAGGPDGSNGCCSALIRLYEQRAEVLAAMAVVEDQAVRHLHGRAVSLAAMPARLRAMAQPHWTSLAEATERRAAPAARRLVDQLQPRLGAAAVSPIRSIYIG